MKLIRTNSKEEVKLGDSLYYHGLDTERYTYVGPSGMNYIKAFRHGRTVLFHPNIFQCELINDSIEAEQKHASDESYRCGDV